MKIFIIILVALVTVSVVAVDETEGMRAMRLGCEKQNLGLGCTNYANFLIKNGRESEADAYFEKGCKLGNQDGCDKKKWPVKEVISPAPEEVIESPIEETPVEETPAPVVPEAEIPATPIPTEVVPAEAETPPTSTEQIPPTEDLVPSPAE